jgi:hypothetical protein
MAKYIEKMLAMEQRQSGKSINAIAKTLGVSKGSVSRWCNDIFLSEIQKNNLILQNSNNINKGRIIANENKKRERINRVNMFNSIGVNKIGNLSNRELFLVGSALYWAEGDKKQRRVTFINSDPKMILLLVKWLKNCLNITLDKLTCRVEINELHKDRMPTIVQYWSNLLNIPLSQFTKPSLKHAIVHKVFKNNDSYFGSLQITVKKGTNLNYEILGYIDGLANAEIVQ